MGHISVTSLENFGEHIMIISHQFQKHECKHAHNTCSRDSSAGIATSYGLDDRISFAGRGQRFLTQALTEKILGAFSWGLRRPGVQLTTQIYLLQMSRMGKLHIHSTTYLHDEVN
jgi:hypothetical protein